MALKLDMSKAYDRMGWKYFQWMLNQMNFPSKMIKLIMKCVTMVIFQVLVNGFPTWSFTPGGGLRQGDPLSAFLFIICTEGMLALLWKTAAHEEIKGVRMGRGGPEITHLLFANDSLLFSNSTLESAEKIKETLHVYVVVFE